VAATAALIVLGALGMHLGRRYTDLRDRAEPHVRRADHARKQVEMYNKFISDWRAMAAEMVGRSRATPFRDLRPTFLAQAAACERRVQGYEAAAALYRAEADDEERIVRNYRRAMFSPWAPAGPFARTVDDAEPAVRALEAAAPADRRPVRR
jgi:hypothetical protein